MLTGWSVSSSGAMLLYIHAWRHISGTGVTHLPSDIVSSDPGQHQYEGGNNDFPVAQCQTAAIDAPVPYAMLSDITSRIQCAVNDEYPAETADPAVRGGVLMDFSLLVDSGFPGKRIVLVSREAGVVAVGM